MNKPEQLCLAADIIEKDLNWEATTISSSPQWMPKEFFLASPDPAHAICQGRQIRLAPPPPEPVPLTAEDVPPGSCLRSDTNHWFAVITCKHNGVYIGSPVRNTILPWEELKNHWQIKRPGQDWTPCHK